jgi:hypothetical protein
MLEARDENNTGLFFVCLLTQIILQSGIDVAGEPKMKIQDPLSKQTLMKSNAQLRCDTFRRLLFMSRCQTLLLHLRMLRHLHSRMSVMHRFWRLWLLYRGHEQYVADCFVYAASNVINTIGGSLYKPPCGAVPTRHPGVPQAPSSIKQ